MPQPDPAFLESALATALRAADAAEAVIARHYRAGFDVEIKADASPVTIADREAEQAVLAVLRASYPEHAMYGEEYGHSGDSPFLWLIDPIDGTKAFVRGYPVFSTQIALMHRGELVLGVSSALQFGERAWARLGGGAFLNGERIGIGPAATLADAQLSLGNVKTLAADSRRWDAVAALVRGANRTRGYGDFLHYHYLARGAVDAVIESDVNILDIAALAVIVREAGAVFTTLEGGPLTLDTRSVLASVPALHADLCARLAP
jgi:histidinol-phosphatase